MRPQGSIRSFSDVQRYRLSSQKMLSPAAWGKASLIRTDWAKKDPDRKVILISDQKQMVLRHLSILEVKCLATLKERRRLGWSFIILCQENSTQLGFFQKCWAIRYRTRSHNKIFSGKFTLSWNLSLLTGCFKSCDHFIQFESSNSSIIWTGSGGPGAQTYPLVMPHLTLLYRRCVIALSY